MKKIVGKLGVLAAMALAAGSALADARWLGNSYIDVNGTWEPPDGQGLKALFFRYAITVTDKIERNAGE